MSNPPRYASQDAAQPHPLYFIVRPDTKRLTDNGLKVSLGPLVPLIAVDELPDWCEIIGVPRELKVEETLGLYNLGAVPKDGVYSVAVIPNRGYPHLWADKGNRNSQIATPEGLHNGSQTGIGNDTTNHDLCPDLDHRHQGITIASPSVLASSALSIPPQGAGTKVGWQRTSLNQHQANARPAMREQQQQQQQQQDESTCLATNSSTTPSDISSHQDAVAGVDGAIRYYRRSGTGFCKHWCRHGFCKWGSNCRYVHCMPNSTKDLAKVGLKEFPRWWTAAMNMVLVGRPDSMSPLGIAESYNAQSAAGVVDRRQGTRAMMIHGNMLMGLPTGPNAQAVRPGVEKDPFHPTLARRERETTPLEPRAPRNKHRISTDEALSREMYEGRDGRHDPVNQETETGRAVENTTDSGHRARPVCERPAAGAKNRDNSSAEHLIDL
ncbi:hypothetical protein GQ53DRAFT_830190 [Thozetella sp. PMI_491]|nr:hypothetical protein GQ53DRAFT_830190 [Thozetella sp. PMI_491]